MADNIRPDDFNEIIALFPPLPAERIRAIQYADVLPLRRLSWLLAYLLERDRRVATFAGPPECATMGVVLAVAGIAIRGQRDLGDILGNVAGLAVETAMRPGQRVARLCVVIEAPPAPIVRVMAQRTARP